MLRFRCPKCGQTYQGNDYLVGAEFKCTHCNAAFPVPNPSAAPWTIPNSLFFSFTGVSAAILIASVAAILMGGPQSPRRAPRVALSSSGNVVHEAHPAPEPVQPPVAPTPAPPPAHEATPVPPTPETPTVVVPPPPTPPVAATPAPQTPEVVVPPAPQPPAATPPSSPALHAIIHRGAKGWHYLAPATATDPGIGATFMQPKFVEKGWTKPATAAPLGYGQTDRPGLVQTTIADPGNGNRYTAYFRKTFNIADKSAFSSLTIELCRDDGAIVYLNGTELKRDNMPAGAVTFTTPASTNVAGDDEAAYFTYTGLANLLVDGANVLAVEVHQSSPTSSDLSFDMSLSGTPAH